MEKTININLGGTLFSVEEAAYKYLRDYLQSLDSSLKNTPGGNEALEDIEQRIAEIFRSQIPSGGVVTYNNVAAMIDIIGKPEDISQSENVNYDYSYTTRKRRLFRNTDDQIIGGVCGGIGAYLGTDPVWIRLLIVILALFFGVGFFLYLILWIALPAAITENDKKELFGNQYYSERLSADGKNAYATSKVGNAFNEIFRAVGRVCYIIVRIILAFFGVAIVLTGFLALLSFLAVFIFRFPGAFSTGALGLDITYMPDFLNYVVNQKSVIWILILSTITVALPSLAMIYGGLKMIFWFRAKDGVILLIGLILWVLSAGILSIVLFNEGVGFAENARATTEVSITKTPQKLYIITGRKVDDLKPEKEIILPDDDYRVFISDSKNEMYINPNLYISQSDSDEAVLRIIKKSHGRTRIDAMANAESLNYGYTISGDTLFVDEFFTLPSGKKWSNDMVVVNVFAPEGTIVYIDRYAEALFGWSIGNAEVNQRLWIVTEDSIEPYDPEEAEK